jgi:hypothetical protein
VAEELLEHVFVDVIPDLVRDRARTWPFDVSRRARHSTTEQTTPASRTSETGAEWE